MLWAFDLEALLGCLPRHLQNHYYIVPHYGALAFTCLLVVLVPWVGAWLKGRLGLFVAAVVTAAVLAVWNFFWLRSSSRLMEDELQCVLAVHTAFLFLLQLGMICLSAWAAKAWLQRQLR